MFEQEKKDEVLFSLKENDCLSHIQAYSRSLESIWVCLYKVKMTNMFFTSIFRLLKDKSLKW